MVGYVGYPEALYVRGLAQGLSQRGHETRVVEPRQNDAFARTLRKLGSAPARHFHDAFPRLQRHTFEPRSGGRLLEWVAREAALIDVAVAVDGLDAELCRWLANVSRDGLKRVYLTYRPAQLTEPVVDRLEVNRFDATLAPAAPAAELRWLDVPATVAPADSEAGLGDRLGELAVLPLVDPLTAADAFIAAIMSI